MANYPSDSQPEHSRYEFLKAFRFVPTSRLYLPKPFLDSQRIRRNDQAKAKKKPRRGLLKWLTFFVLLANAAILYYANKIASIGLLAHLETQLTVMGYGTRTGQITLIFRNSGRTDAFNFQIHEFHRLEVGTDSAKDDPFAIYMHDFEKTGKDNDTLSLDEQINKWTVRCKQMAEKLRYNGRISHVPPEKTATALKKLNDMYISELKILELEKTSREWPVGYLSDIPSGGSVSFNQSLNGQLSRPEGRILFVFGTYSYEDASDYKWSHIRYCQEFVADVNQSFSCLRRPAGTAKQQETNQSNKGGLSRPK
ncbi:MAG: hypothetical protein JO108_29795 [Acidobacteriaceae bacterium]|nr:hypothetical protein [Acidobacteriaceae bacterium]